MADDLHVRLLRPEDAAEVSALVHRCLREVNSRDYSDDVIDAMCEQYTADRFPALARQRHVYVAENSVGLAGTVSLEGHVVYTMFVSPDHSGHGVGRKLMEHVEDVAVAGGHERMETNASITARAFYLRLGYVEVSSADGPHGRTYRMRKDLAGR